MKKILFTGGGTIGHVAVNVALIAEFRKFGYNISYIGSKSGIEKEMIESISDVRYYEISSGKLRRYFSIKNFTDPFRVLKGIIESIIIMKKEKPNFVFSKGGFVSVPVCIAAKILKIPSLLHESDLSPGLANKINIKFCKHIFTTFEETINYLPKEKSSLIGVIVRDDIYTGEAEKAYKFTGLNKAKPIILVMGGSLGSKIINEYIWNNLSKLLEKYQIIHLVGKDLYNKNAKGNGYVQYEFLNKELFDIFQIVDFSISRAGANSIYEFLALNIPSILIPLGKNQSRGDQIENASFFEKNNFAKVINENDLPNLDTKYFDDFSSNIPTIKNNMINYKKEKDIINTSKKFYNKILDILED
ncbi:undecaprenyldiphospho-muramoylpentapeptide beta-N-acetylglucosaminyltransferase [Gemella sp. zg-570]|uniref:undecaprenyldiphospho-muramoylpentapeptide beta-N-acetylglucosaminyltransferase n=1 Tax=unclassified Gemella TaxID=2624949 RepID=UPI001C04B0D3|nr:undecaprenyldiphospho-muramoylpentapeptide beta-N-acetylglucosaminyltransferase [Gemella sp. zg-570]MBU0278311.1 undecaprenyldiphospho-muramoylpentapeptide beta-N-acetylglucosaminyltransferase [Gemella sp. zg-1178]QWQ38184.1 undecaprenyldiphospho-muramoylpentapeptide beta-N-acetylglucosaminyltransferase [Gemella sp. zg-570]